LVTVLTYCRLADYDSWRPQYEEAVKRVPVKLGSHQIYRDQDDPNFIVILETVDSRGEVEAVLNSAEFKRQQAARGVDMGSLTIRYLDEVGSGLRE
jgi:hypothetical protein